MGHQLRQTGQPGLRAVHRVVKPAFATDFFVAGRSAVRLPCGGRLSLATPSPTDGAAGMSQLVKSLRSRAMKRRARKLDAAKGRMPRRVECASTGMVCDGSQSAWSQDWHPSAPRRVELARFARANVCEIYRNLEKCQFKELSTFQWLRVSSHFAPSRRPAVSQIGFACVRRNQFLTKCNPDAVAGGFSFPLGWVWHTEVRQVRGRLTDERHVHPQRRATADGPDASS